LNTLRLSDFALHCKDPQVRSIIFDLVRSGSVMARDIPFATKHSLRFRGSRIDSLPDIPWVDLNDEDLTGEHALPVPFEESAYIFRALVQTDEAEDKSDDQIENAHALSCEAYIRGFAYAFNDSFINNHHRDGGEKKGLIGLRERLDFNAKYGTLAANKINGAGVDMTPTGDAADLESFAEMLNELLWRLGSPNGDGVILYVASEFKWRLDAKLSRLSGSGGFSTAKDQFGLTVTKYKGAQIEDIGTKGDQTTGVITVTETAAGLEGADHHTSIYGVNYGLGHTAGWTHIPLGAKEVPDGNTGIFRKTRMEWIGGIFFQSQRSIGRIHGIKYSNAA